MALLLLGVGPPYSGHKPTPTVCGGAVLLLYYTAVEERVLSLLPPLVRHIGQSSNIGVKKECSVEKLIKFFDTHPCGHPAISQRA